MQCNAMQCNAMQCNAMQCNAMQCNAMQCNAMQCNAMQNSSIWCNPIQSNTLKQAALTTAPGPLDDPTMTLTSGVTQDVYGHVSVLFCINMIKEVAISLSRSIYLTCNSAPYSVTRRCVYCINPAYSHIYHYPLFWSASGEWCRDSASLSWHAISPITSRRADVVKGEGKMAISVPLSGMHFVHRDTVAAYFFSPV